jgi:hypothetical protein
MLFGLSGEDRLTAWSQSVAVSGGPGEKPVLRATKGSLNHVCRCRTVFSIMDKSVFPDRVGGAHGSANH